MAGEDHTLGNAVRHMLNRHPSVVFAGYSVPHPSDDVVNVCVQTNGAISAQQAMRDAVTDLARVCDTVMAVFDAAVARFRAAEAAAAAAAGEEAAAAARAAAAAAQDMSDDD